MSNGRLSFSIALNLLADNFKKGAASVTASLRSMQYRVLGMVGALGAGGFALKDIIGKMVSMARETNRARVSLRNISGGVEGYGRNLKFLIDLSQKYGQDLNTLTINFARFSAAGNAAGVSMADQEKIYTSITRAVTAFGLSGDEANLTFLALQQMMAKGKISSEELRRQMGERMPIAMQAMANAAGVNIQQLDRMIKNGELYAKDILPKFAEEMEKLLPEVSTDNIETSVNRLRTQFTKLTESLGVGKAYKKIVDGATKVLKYIEDNIASTVRRIIALVSGVLINKMVKRYLVFQATAVAAHRKVELAAYESAWREELAQSNLTRKQQAEILKRRMQTLLAHQENMGFVRKFSITAIASFRAIGAALMSIAPLALITLLTTIIAKIVHLNKEAKETTKIFSEYQKGLKAVSGGAEVERMRQLQKIMNSRKSTQQEINKAQAELMRMLGLQQGQENSINKKLEERITLLEAAARVDFAIQKKLEAEDEIKRITSKYGGVSAYNEEVRRQKATDAAIGNSGTSRAVAGVLNFIDGVFDRENSRGGAELRRDRAKISQLNKVINQATADIGDHTRTQLKYTDVFTPDYDPAADGGGKNTGEKSDLQKAEEKYVDGLRELNNRLAVGNITQKEYDEELSRLSKTTTDTIAGLLGINSLNNSIYNAALKNVTPELTEFQKAQKEYNENLAKLNNLKANGVIVESKYNDEMTDLLDNTLHTVGVMDDLNDEGREFIKALQKQRKEIIGSIVEKERDTKFDYKKSETDKIEESIKLKKEYINSLRKDLVNNFDEIVKAEKELEALSEQLELAEAEEDLKKIKEELNSLKSALIKGYVGILKDFDSALNGVVSAAKRLKDVLNDIDASGFEKFSAVVKLISESVDGVFQTVDAYKKVVDIVGKLTKAKEVEGAVTATVTGIKKASAGAEAAASGTVAAAAMSEAGAHTANAAAKAASAHAWMPFVGVGLAAAAIGVLVGSIVSARNKIPKYAGGGIVGGGSLAGDQLLIRANSGEMILNQSQQSNLFRAIKSGNMGTSLNGKVVFEIQGKHLRGVLEQDKQRNSRI